MNQNSDNVFVQSYISNIGFPKSLDELLSVYIMDRGEFDLERVLSGYAGGWTAPKWAKKDDIVFFMHAKYAIKTITALATELRNTVNSYDADDVEELGQWLTKGRNYHKTFGGKIFAIGRVGQNPAYYKTEDQEEVHWRSGIYAEIEDCWVLENPVDIAEFRDFIFVSRQSSITPVYGETYEKLKTIIVSKNPNLPEYFLRSVATPIPLSKINDSNWITITNEYRRSFILELQFRSYYVDCFLQVLGDRKKIYRECRCQKAGTPDSFVDNIILFNGRYLPVEVKLNVDNETDLSRQVKKYCHDDIRYFDSGVGKKIDNSKSYMDEVLVIDTERIILYRDTSGKCQEIIELDKIQNEQDIYTLRNQLITLLG